MPKPRAGESESDFVSRCTPIVMSDGTTDDNKQAVAICYSMYRKGKKSADLEALKYMGEMGVDKYAWQEAWGIENAANVLSSLAMMAQEETSEPQDLQGLANIMRSLMAFIAGEITQMVDAAKVGEEKSAPETVPAEVKSEESGMNLSYAKSLQVELPDFLAVKFTAKDEIKGYSHLWGSEELADLEVEYFTQQSDFWDDRFDTKTRPLTWDHAQDPDFKAEPIIGQIVDFGDDDVGRWYVAKLNRAHQYNRAIAELIKAGKLGTSSDSAPQYVERVKTGKATWLKTWPFFAAALTDTPCEPRMIGSLEFFKSLGVNLPDMSVIQTPTWEAEAAIFDYFKVKYNLGD